MAAVIVPSLFAQIPEWYTTHKNPRYPSEMYILGVGSGSGNNAVEAAKKAAQTDLVSQIRVQIQAQVKNVSESFQFNKDEQLSSDFRSNVRTAVNDEITGMEVAETVTDNSTGAAYALVVLERDKYCENLGNEMNSGWKQITDLRTASSDDAKKGKLNDAVQSLLDARVMVAPLVTKQALYNTISNTPYKQPVTFGPTTLTTDLRQLLSNVKLTKKSGDNQKGRIGETFAAPFVVQVMVNQNESSVPGIGATVIFETSDNIKVGDAVTDDQGQASMSTTVRAMKGNGIRARLSFRKLDRDFEQALISTAVTFSWKAEASNIVFALKIEAKSGKISSTLRNAFSSVITQIGYKVVNSSNHVIEVTTENAESSKVEGMAGTMYSVSAKVVATLIDKESNNTLGSVSFAGKGLARSESEAAEKAINNLQIGQNDLSDLLQKANQQ